MLNVATLMGHICTDFKKVGDNGPLLCRLAVDRSRKNKVTGERETDFIPLTFWGSQAQYVEKNFRKGDGVIVHGSLRSREYVDRNEIKRQEVALQVDEIFSYDKKPRPEKNGGEQV